MSRRIPWACLAVLLACTLPAAGQDGGSLLPASEPTSAPAGLWPGADVMGDAGAESMTPEELAELIRQARPIRMKNERTAVGREIQDGLLFDRVDEALQQLQDNPADTPEDNIRRITRAFATVDSRLADPAGKFEQGKFDQAGTGVKAIINPGGTGYLDAAKQMMYADSLTAQRRYSEAVQAYGQIIKEMPDKISFAAMAALRGGEAFEKMHRMKNAVLLYHWWLENYGFLDPQRAEPLVGRIKQLEEDYRQPMQTLAGRMETVQQRLGQADSGKDTQVKQKEIVDMLDDLIVSAQEDQNNQSQGQGQEPSQAQKDQEKGKPQAGQPQGQNKPPSSPAGKSALTNGNSPRPTGMAGARPSDTTDDWGRLQPRDRERLMEMLKQKYPERYTQMLEAYYRKLSEQR